MTKAKPKKKPAVVKPLCKPKFLAQTVLDLIAFCEPFSIKPVFRPVLDHRVPQVTPTLKAIQAMPLADVADVLWKLNSELHSAALYPKNDYLWVGREGLREDMIKQPRIGDIVTMRMIRSSRYANAVGQLICIDQEINRPGRQAAYHWEDGGPPSMSPRYMLKLLDGTIMTWGNAQVSYMPSFRTFEMWRGIDAKFEADELYQQRLKQDRAAALQRSRDSLYKATSW